MTVEIVRLSVHQSLQHPRLAVGAAQGLRRGVQLGRIEPDRQGLGAVCDPLDQRRDVTRAGAVELDALPR